MIDKKEKSIGIEILIPTGHEKAVSRENLCRTLGASDRGIRRMIHEARRDHIILNLQDGSGYYQPDLEDPTDRAELAKYALQEEHRLKSIGWALKPVRKALREHEASHTLTTAD